MAWIVSRGNLRHAALVLGLLLASGFGAGCGKSNSQRAVAYRTQVSQLGESFVSTVAGLRNSPVPRSQTEALDRVGRFESVLSSVEKRARRLRAPEPAAALHRKLIRAIDRYGAELRRAVADAAATNPLRRRQSLSRFLAASQSASSAVQTTIAKINAKLGPARR